MNLTTSRSLLVCAVAFVAVSCATGSAPSSAPGDGAGISGFRAITSATPPAAPVRVRVPALHLDAPVERVGRAPDGTVQVPHRWDDVGWYADGPRPGAPGPAVLLGHVDSTSGPAVFYRLREVRRGAVVEVVRADASVVRFRVTRVARYPKARFPTTDVYLPTLVPELRLVTCGGLFNSSTGHYVDNVIAYAELVSR